MLRSWQLHSIMLTDRTSNSGRVHYSLSPIYIIVVCSWAKLYLIIALFLAPCFFPKEVLESNGGSWQAGGVRLRRWRRIHWALIIISEAINM